MFDRTETIVANVDARTADERCTRGRVIANQLPISVHVAAVRRGRAWFVTVRGSRRDVAVFLTYWKDE